MIKILAVKYPSVIDVDTKREVRPVKYTSDAKNIQQLIKKLLFQEQFNYLLIGLDNKLHICEPIDVATQQYSRRIVDYHPFANEIIAQQ